MKAYELLIMLDPTLEEDARSGVVEKAHGLIAADGGVVDNTDTWGKRKLAFEIDKMTEGDYELIEFHATPDSIAELDRVLHITDPVVRYMIVRRDDRK